MIANFQGKRTNFLKEQVAVASSNSSSITELNITHGQIYANAEHEKQEYRKHNLNASDTALIKQYLADSQIIHIIYARKQVAAGETGLDQGDEKCHSRRIDFLGNAKLVSALNVYSGF